MRLPNKKRFPSSPIFLAILVVLALATGGCFYFFPQKNLQEKTIDNFPVMLINNCKTAVYRELRVSKNSIENQIVVSGLTDEDQSATKIYEFIPKEVAQKASDLEFSVQPQILEDDPLIMWHLGPLDGKKPKKIQYTVKRPPEMTQCVEKGYVADVAKYGLNPLNFDDCYKYFGIKFEEAVEKNKKLREEREKDQVRLVKSDESRYREIQKTAKEVIQKDSNGKTQEQELYARPKMTNEEAVIAVKNSRFGEQLKFGEQNGGKPVECTASWNAQKGYYQVVCIQEDFYYAQWNYYYFMYNFFTVSSKREVQLVGDYVKKRESSTHTVAGWSEDRYFGKPMWGVK